MPKCKKSESQAIDYAIGELDVLHIVEYEKHLTTCNYCIRQVNAIKHLLQLVDKAESELTPQAIVPPNLETKLYRRLAEEPFKQPKLHSRFLDFFSRFGMTLQAQKVVTVCLFTVAIITIAFFLGNPFQNDPTFQLSQTESVDVRIEQYHDQGMQRSMEDVIRNKHLRNSDEWNTVSELNRVKDQAYGTDWAIIANKHIKRVSSKL